MEQPDLNLITPKFSDVNANAQMSAYTSKLQEILEYLSSNIQSNKVVTSSPSASEMNEWGRGGVKLSNLFVIHNATASSRKIAYLYNGTVHTIDSSMPGLWEVDGNETQLASADEIDMQSKNIINLLDPTANQHAATKKYHDDDFDTTSGHDHDGTDSKKVIATNLDGTGITNGHILYNNSGAIAGKAEESDISLLSVTDTNGATNSGDITIAPNKQYMVNVDIIPTTTTPSTTLDLLFGDTNGADSGASDYSWVRQTLKMDGTPTNTIAGDDADTSIDLLDVGITNSGGTGAHFTMYINTYKDSSENGVVKTAFVYGDGFLGGQNPARSLLHFGGVYLVDTTVTHFEFVTGQNANFDIRVYELAQS